MSPQARIEIATESFPMDLSPASGTNEPAGEYAYESVPGSTGDTINGSKKVTPFQPICVGAITLDAGPYH